MLRPTAFRGEASRCPTQTTLHQTSSSNRSGLQLRSISNQRHTVSKNQVVSLKFSPSVLATVHTFNSKLAPISQHFLFHTSQRLHEESSAQPLSVEQNQLTNTTSVNYVQLDKAIQSFNTEVNEQAIATTEDLQIKAPSANPVHTNPSTPSLDAESAFRVGYELSQQGKHVDALKLFKKALKLDPTHYTSYHWLGYTYSSIGKQQKAIINFLQSINHAPANSKLLVETYNNLGQSYISQRMYAESLDALDKVVLMDKNNKLAHYNRGYALMMMEIFDYAIKCFTITLKLDPKHLGSLQCKAYCLILQRKFEEALDFVRAAETMYPNDLTLQIYKEAAVKRFFRQNGVYPLADLLAIQSTKGVRTSSHFQIDNDD